MAHPDIDNLLEQSLSGHPPDAAFRAGVLRASMAALERSRRDHVRRRRIQFGLVAALVAAASFLVGRCAAPSAVTLPPAPVAVEPGETVRVSRELIAWLEAANLFRQVGMQDRMARAVGRAGGLLPDDVEAVPNEPDATLVDYRPGEVRKDQPFDWIARSHTVTSGECLNRIIAQSLGD
jgi:hypothetical protein